MNLFSCFSTKISQKTIPSRKVCFSPEICSISGENEKTQTIMDIQYIYPSLPYDIKPGFIYLIQEREFIKTKENIYKIGKTINIKHRMPSYPKQSLLYFCFYCTTCIDVVEKSIILLFDSKFKKRIDIGSEYYEGDLATMIKYLTLFLNQQYCTNLPYSASATKQYTI
jgi:hypothetical protein